MEGCGGGLHARQPAIDSSLSRVRVARTRTSRPEIQPHSSQRHTPANASRQVSHRRQDNGVSGWSGGQHAQRRKLVTFPCASHLRVASPPFICCLPHSPWQPLPPHALCALSPAANGRVCVCFLFVKHWLGDVRACAAAVQPPQWWLRALTSVNDFRLRVSKYRSACRCVVLKLKCRV